MIPQIDAISIASNDDLYSKNRLKFTVAYVLIVQQYAHKYRIGHEILEKFLITIIGM